MHPVNDIEAVLLLATALASKRRPAELAEIIAAADLIQGFIPYESKLSDAFYRLAAHGLVCEKGSGFALTPAAQKIVSSLPAKAEIDQRLAAVKEELFAYVSKGDSAPIVLTSAQFKAALTAHRAAQTGTGRSMLMPKPKMDRHFKVDGKWRRASAARGRKT
ncbi:MAG: hypothetical protein M0P39_00605 [Rhodocyclaceae bacterium]|nr:hypothetical protein [Rhodocyclaceae bacterium]